MTRDEAWAKLVALHAMIAREPTVPRAIALKDVLQPLIQECRRILS